LAQISGRNFLSWEDKFKKDVIYVASISFINDAKIFWITFIKVLRRADIEVDQCVAEIEAMDTLRIKLSKLK
jgi:undecaprenyl phosphate N,N'-diacetylbacillosamine 1-phosphate transferase